MCCGTVCRSSARSRRLYQGALMRAAHAVEASASAKFRKRVLVPIVLLIVLSSLDRVNIRFAGLPMTADLSLAPEAYGFAVGLCFVGYVLCQFPSAWRLTRTGATRRLAGSVVLWGTFATAMAFAQTAEQLYVLRFLLGCAE